MGIRKAIQKLIHDNHEIWVTCPKCGREYDLRKDDFCPYCGVNRSYDSERDF